MLVLTPRPPDTHTRTLELIHLYEQIVQGAFSVFNEHVNNNREFVGFHGAKCAETWALVYVAPQMRVTVKYST